MSGFALLIAIIVVSYLVKNFIWNSQWEITSIIDSARKYSSIGFFYFTIIKSIEAIFVSKSFDVALIKYAVSILFISSLGFIFGILIFKFNNRHSKNKNYDEFWGVALKEIESNNKDLNIWAKSIAEANGDNKKATAIYLRKRVKIIYSDFKKVQKAH